MINAIWVLFFSFLRFFMSCYDLIFLVTFNVTKQNVLKAIHVWLITSCFIFLSVW